MKSKNRDSYIELLILIIILVSAKNYPSFFPLCSGNSCLIASLLALCTYCVIS